MIHFMLSLKLRFVLISNNLQIWKMLLFCQLTDRVLYVDVTYDIWPRHPAFFLMNDEKLHFLCHPFPQTAFGIDAILLWVTRAFWISIYLKQETGRNCNGSLISFCHVAAALALSRFFRGAQNQCPHSVGNSLPNPLVILTSRSSKVIAR